MILLTYIKNVVISVALMSDREPSCTVKEKQNCSSAVFMCGEDLSVTLSPASLMIS